MGNVYFFTGFPGFIATQLIKEILRQKRPLKHVYVLVLPKLVSKAQQELERLYEMDSQLQGRCTD
nr:SDR family oxidoreductase [Caldalkalibacillus mannanilyticus]